MGFSVRQRPSPSPTTKPTQPLKVPTQPLTVPYTAANGANTETKPAIVIIIYFNDAATAISDAATAVSDAATAIVVAATAIGDVNINTARA